MLPVSMKLMAVSLLFMASGVNTSSHLSGLASSARGSRQDTVPLLSVSESVGNDFMVHGSNFARGKRVQLRVSSPATPRHYFNAVANENGTFSLVVPGVCAGRGPVHFSASDGRVNQGKGAGALWSRTVSESCR